MGFLTDPIYNKPKGKSLYPSYCNYGGNNDNIISIGTYTGNVYNNYYGNNNYSNMNSPIHGLTPMRSSGNVDHFNPFECSGYSSYNTYQR